LPKFFFQVKKEEILFQPNCKIGRCITKIRFCKDYTYVIIAIMQLFRERGDLPYWKWMLAFRPEDDPIINYDRAAIRIGAYIVGIFLLSIFVIISINPDRLDLVSSYSKYVTAACVLCLIASFVLKLIGGVKGEIIARRNAKERQRRRIFSYHDMVNLYKRLLNDNKKKTQDNKS
jgi:hypothetical protein